MTRRAAKKSKKKTPADPEEIGWGETECLEEAAGVTRKIEGEVSRAWGVDAGEGEVLKEHAKFFSVGLFGV
jgi:hypothetical protein